jgi:hypothetical protein
VQDGVSFVWVLGYGIEPGPSSGKSTLRRIPEFLEKQQLEVVPKRLGLSRPSPSYDSLK